MYIGDNAYPPSEWSPDSDTGPFSRQEMQNGRPSRIGRFA